MKMTLYRMLSRIEVELTPEQIDARIKQATQNISLDPQDVSSHLDRARCYKQKEEFDKAIADYTKVIELEPKHKEIACVYENRALSYCQKGDFDKAIEDYNRAIGLDNWSYYYYLRGKAYAEKGDVDKAIADYAEAVKLDSDDDKFKSALEQAKSSATKEGASKK